MAENPFDRTNPTMRDCWDAGHAAGVAAEREACRALCDELDNNMDWPECVGASRCEDAIHNRQIVAGEVRG